MVRAFTRLLRREYSPSDADSSSEPHVHVTRPRRFDDPKLKLPIKPWGEGVSHPAGGGFDGCVH
jgi:hypothetical protein